MQRGHRKSHYDASWIKAQPFVKRRHCYEVSERIDHRGNVVALLDETKLRDLARSIYAAGNTGGQRLRVALGRAIIRRPAMFLMDEPLSKLDLKLREQMRTELKRLHRTLGITTVYVTHDLVEVLTLSHRIAVMQGGNVQQIGSPTEIFERPANLFVAEFIGSPGINLLKATADENGLRIGSSQLPDALRFATYRHNE
jgi:ABC-type sugar transport system ATPase subunit